MSSGVAGNDALGSAAQPSTEPILDPTHTVFVAPGAGSSRNNERIHYLLVEAGAHAGERILLTEAPMRIGREAPCEVVLGDNGISRSHCRIERRFDELVVTDLGSTNGSFIDGRKVVGSTMFPVGSTLAIGQHVLRHESGTRRDFDESVQLDLDMQEARSYVQALLPPPQREGPVRIDWLMRPSAKLGGDALGYHALDARRIAMYLVDVSGHGARSAMHGVSVTNVLRHHALPGVDFGCPDLVLRGLNAMFAMESHNEMYFTIWYGIFDKESRTLRYASGGHHPAFLIPETRSDPIRLQTPNIPVGAMPGFMFTDASVTVGPRSALYLFSDGAFELVAPDGRETRLSDFVPFLTRPRIQDVGEPLRLFRAAMELGGRDTFDDDLSILVAELD